MRVVEVRDLELPSAIVPVSDDEGFVVRGINFSDVTSLIYRHGPALALMYAKFSEQKKAAKITPELVGEMIVKSVGEFPEAVHQIIALATGAPDQFEKIANLRFPVQVDAISKIVALTFTSEHELKKVFETVTRMFEMTTGAVATLTTPLNSDNGNGAFVSR